MQKRVWILNYCKMLSSAWKPPPPRTVHSLEELNFSHLRWLQWFPHQPGTNHNYGNNYSFNPLTNYELLQKFVRMARWGKSGRYQTHGFLFQFGSCLLNLDKQFGELAEIGWIVREESVKPQMQTLSFNSSPWHSDSMWKCSRNVAHIETPDWSLWCSIGWLWNEQKYRYYHVSNGNPQNKHANWFLASIVEQRKC